MRPPYSAEKLIHWLCRDSLADEILGDLYEEYQSNFTKKGKIRAGVQHWISALRFINTRTLKRNIRLTNDAMLKIISPLLLEILPARNFIRLLI